MRPLDDLDVDRSPAGPPPGPTSPSPASWIRVPVSTPGGIFSVSVRRVRTRPSPPHSGHGSRDDDAEALARGHGRAVMTWPRNDAGDLLDLAAALADVARCAGDVPGAVPVAGARRADDGGVDLDVAGRAERRLGEVDLEPDQRVLPATLARPRAALRRRRRRRTRP